MIVYVLLCENGHRFDAWFRDSGAFESQQRDGALSCPNCASLNIRKAPNAPHVARARSATPAEAKAGETASPGEIAELLTQLREHIESRCDYVGEQFAEQARRIHYGETEKRDIYGEATTKEASELRAEGIDVAAIPMLVRRNG